MIRWGLATAFIAAVSACDDRGAPETRSSVSPLKQLASAQAEFRGNDRDGNGVQDFWRKDVRGLYDGPGADGRPLKLLEASVAAADARPYVGDAGKAPKGGYWYRSIRHAGEIEPDPNRFAFCAYPEDYGLTGKNTFVIDERNTIFKKDLGHGRGIEVFPDNLDKEGWLKLD